MTTERREIGEGMTENEARAARRFDLLANRFDPAVAAAYAELGSDLDEFEARRARPRVVFVDIDGVLLRRCDWLHPRNAPARALLREKGAAGRRLAMEAVSFDPNGVELVNRLARETGGKLVVVSNWRRTLGVEETHQKLISEGIDPSLFHDDHSCEVVGGGPEKAREVRWWLHDHRTTPDPGPSPAGHAATDEAARAMSEAIAAWHGAYENVGIDWLVLDDEPGPERLLRTHPERGFDAEDYRVAVRALGGEDREFGVRTLPADLWSEVLAAHLGDPVAAARWVEGAHEPATYRPVRLLDWRETQALDLLTGRADATDEQAREEAVEAFRRRLREDRPQPADGPPASLDNDF